MNRIIIVLILIAPSLAQACNVRLSNSADVDLIINLHEKKSIIIAPSEAVTIPYSRLRYIEFGAVEHEYPIDSAKAIICPAKKHRDIEIEAGKDGKLWLRCGKQINPFPLVPTKMRDLTVFSGKNNDETAR